MSAADSLARVDGLLEALGYDSRLTERGFPVWIGDDVVDLDLVAFGAAQPHDMTTATLAVIVSRDRARFDQAFRGAQALTAPALLVADSDSDSVELWSVGETPTHRRTLGWGEVSTAGRLAAELAPERLLRAKQSGRQLGLFTIEAELLVSSRQSTVDSLAGRVASAVKHAQRRLKDAKPDHVARLVVGSMAMLMVSDKLEGDRSAAKVEALASARFPSYFNWLGFLTASERDVLVSLLDELGQDINYRGLDPTLVSDVYEHALLDNQARKSLSVFYTPPDVARTLVAATPFEFVAPEDRTVLDLACGSGTLLVAAHDRMRAVTSPRLDFEQTHRYLTSHLFGFDTDPFAVEIAKLSLLLAALPIGNSWRIERRAVGQGLPPDLPPITFVLSNPPWSTTWRQKDEGSQQRRTNARVEAADRFVRASLDLLQNGGYLSLLLPATLFESRASRSLRTWLDGQVSLLEVVRLPEDTFANSVVETAAVVMQKGGSSRSSYAFRRALRRPGWRAMALAERDPDVNVAVPAHGALLRGLLAHGPLDSASLKTSRTLGDIADVHGGAVPTPGFSPSVRAQGPYLWMPKAGSMPFLQPLQLDELAPTTYPIGFNWRGSNPEHFLRPKVLVSGVRTPTNPWRVHVRVDTQGVIPRNSLHFVAPRNDGIADLDALAAYMTTAPVAAWVDQHNTSRSIRLTTLRSVPAPDDPQWWKQLSNIGREMRKGAVAGVGPTRDELTELDDTVMKAWGLTRAQQQAVRSLLAGFPGPEGIPRYDDGVRSARRSTSGDSLRAPGAVLGLTKQGVHLWVAGVTPRAGVEVELPRRFPGALLFKGATFDCEIVGNDLEGADYRIQRQSWKDEDDVFAGRN